MLHETRLIRTILAALDGSPHARDVFDVAEKFARRFEARLVVLRVIDPSTTPHDESLDNPPPSRVVAAALADLVKLTDGRRVVAHVRHGVPWKVILDTSEEESADLIVIGGHRYRGLDHVLGSTEKILVERAPRSVYVVRGRL